MWTYVASGPSAAMRTWLLNGKLSSNKMYLGQYSPFGGGIDGG